MSLTKKILFLIFGISVVSAASLVDQEVVELGATREALISQIINEAEASKTADGYEQKLRTSALSYDYEVHTYENAKTRGYRILLTETRADGVYQSIYTDGVLTEDWRQISKAGTASSTPR